MTKKQKYLGLFAILPLLIVTLSSGAIGEAMAEESASVEMTSINQEGDRAYDVSFSIYAGDEALPDGKLLVTSDSQSREVLFRGVSAGLSAGSGQVRITADDPSSIMAEMITEKKGEFNLPGVESKAAGPWVELASVIQDGDITYKLIFDIHAGDEALPDGKLLVTSDSESREVLFRGVSAGMTAGSGQVRITAEDPGSLSVQIQDIVNEVDILTSNKWARQK